MADLYAFPASDTFTPEQALLSALEFTRDEGDNTMQDVIVAGHDADGMLIIRSSRMTRKDALWLAEEIRLHALGND